MKSAGWMRRRWNMLLCSFGGIQHAYHCARFDCFFFLCQTYAKILIDLDEVIRFPFIECHTKYVYCFEGWFNGCCFCTHTHTNGWQMFFLCSAQRNLYLTNRHLRNGKETKHKHISCTCETIEIYVHKCEHKHVRNDFSVLRMEKRNGVRETKRERGKCDLDKPKIWVRMLVHIKEKHVLCIAMYLNHETSNTWQTSA